MPTTTIIRSCYECDDAPAVAAGLCPTCFGRQDGPYDDRADDGYDYEPDGCWS